jgi:hypothetical protein
VLCGDVSKNNSVCERDRGVEERYKGFQCAQLQLQRCRRFEGLWWMWKKSLTISCMQQGWSMDRARWVCLGDGRCVWLGGEGVSMAGLCL